MKVAAAVAATFLAATLWGTSFVANHYGLGETGALAFTALRFAVAALSCWLVLLVVDRRAALSPPWKSAPLWVFGALVAAAFVLQYLGQERTTPGRAALFVNANVFTVALLQVFVQRERPGAGMLASAAVALAGLVLLTSDRAGSASLFGDALAFASGAAFAVYVVLTKRWVAGEGLLATTTWTFAATTVLLAPFALAADLPRGPVGWGAVVYTGLLCSTVAYALWMFGLRTISPTASAVILLVEVPVAATLSVALGLERFGPREAFGAGLLLAGVAAASLLEARAAKTPPTAPAPPPEAALAAAPRR